MKIYNYTYPEAGDMAQKNRSFFKEKFGFDAIDGNTTAFKSLKKWMVRSYYMLIPTIFSPSFKEQYSKQIGREIINKSGLTGICDNTDFHDKNVKFEIIDYVPDKFPSYDNLSQPLKDKVEDITQLGFDVHYHFFDRAYDPNLWKKEMKLCYDAINKKLEARARRKLSRNKREKFPVETAEKCYFPDLTFNIRLKKAGSEGAAAVIEAAIMELGRNISEETGYGFEAISVDATADNQCQLVIDFGMCETDAVDKVIDTLASLGLGIEKVVIE